LGFLTYLLQFAFWNGYGKFLEKEIPCIQNEDLLPILLYFLDPRPPLGQTANPDRLVSGGTGINLTVQIVAVKDGERPCPLLGMGRKVGENRKRPDKKNEDPELLPLHWINLQITYLYLTRPLKTSIYEINKVLIQPGIGHRSSVPFLRSYDIKMEGGKVL
jgi:hypothetical protein